MIMRFQPSTFTTLLFMVVSLGVSSVAVAYPPAPGMTVTGLVRDEYGWALQRNGAQVVFKVGANEVARQIIQSNASFSESYRVQIPMDSGLVGAAYRTGALTVSMPFSVEIHVNGSVYHPIETLRGDLFADDPGSSLTLDLTLGRDQDHDGLPDDWELWQLQAAGFFPGHPDYHLDFFGTPGDADGDGVSDLNEYLTGTMAALASDVPRFRILRVMNNDLVELEYNAVFQRAYRLETSEDGHSWRGVPASLDDPRAPSNSAWVANRTASSQKIYVPGVAPTQFFRLRTR